MLLTSPYLTSLRQSPLSLFLGFGGSAHARISCSRCSADVQVGHRIQHGVIEELLLEPKTTKRGEQEAAEMSNRAIALMAWRVLLLLLLLSDHADILAESLPSPGLDHELSGQRVNGRRLQRSQHDALVQWITRHNLVTKTRKIDANNTHANE